MSEVDEEENLLVLLYRHNLGHVIENIVEYVGHTATVNMLCTCKSWLAILTDIVPLRRLVFLRSLRDKNFARHCHFNRWAVAPAAEEEQMDQRHLAYINYTSTDLRRIISRNLFERSERYFVGGMVTALTFARRFIICGLIGGHLKMWDTSQGNSWDRIRLFRVLSPPHNDDVTCLSTLGDVLVSGARDLTVRLWRYETGEAMRVLRAGNRHLEAVSLTRDHLICLHHCSVGSEFEVYKSKAVLWRVGSTFDVIDEVSTTPLGHPPYRVMHSYSLDGGRLAYALHNAIRVIEAVGAGFETLFELDLDRRTFVKELHLKGNLLLSTTIDHLIRFTDISSGEDLNTSDIPGPLSNTSADCPSAWLSDFGIVLTYPESRVARIWHWADLLAGKPSTKMRISSWEGDIAFQSTFRCKKDAVVLTAKGVLFLDQLGQGFHAFWFKRPNWLHAKGYDEDEDSCDELT